MAIFSNSQENHVKTWEFARLETEEIPKLILVFVRGIRCTSLFSPDPVHILQRKLNWTE
jgi:hypothetical protein